MKYIILSDLHLGHKGIQNNGFVSLLSNIPEGADGYGKSKLDSFSTAIKDFCGEDKAVLILNGDLLELSLATMRDALDSFLDVIATIKDNVSKIILIVGNHDHHIWSLHSEYSRSLNHLLSGDLPAVGTAYRTTIFAEKAHLLDPLIKKQIDENIDFKVSYPSLRLHLNNGDEPVYCYITHGHLLSGLYNLTSRILKPFAIGRETEYTIAEVNSALIEFMYWSAGEMGDGMGVDGILEAMYTDLEKGKSSKMKELLVNLSNTLFPDGVLSFVPDVLERKIFSWLAEKMSKKLSKDRDKPISSVDRYASLEDTRNYVNDWTNNVVDLSPPYKRMIFVSGHTHRADEFNINETVKYYNTGSWLLEPAHPEPESRLLFIEDGEELKIEFKVI